MILIKDLTKTYKSKNHRVCTALDKVSLALPDTVYSYNRYGSGRHQDNVI